MLISSTPGSYNEHIQIADLSSSVILLGISLCEYLICCDYQKRNIDTNRAHVRVGVVRNYAQRGQPPPFSMAILLAPVFITGEVAVKVTGRLRKPIAAKKWKWESRDIAEDYIKTTFPSKFWDKEMQRILLVRNDVTTP